MARSGCGGANSALKAQPNQGQALLRRPIVAKPKVWSHPARVPERPDSHYKSSLRLIMHLQGGNMPPTTAKGSMMRLSRLH